MRIPCTAAPGRAKLPPARRMSAAVVTLVLAGGLLCAVAHAQGLPTPPSKVYVEGEELIYNVRYGFIDLGQVRIRTVASKRTGSSVVYQGKALIDSYPKVPFVDLHTVYESMMDSTGFSHDFVGRTKMDGQWDVVRYLFQYDRKRVVIEMGVRDSVMGSRDTLSIDTLYHDGLSLFFFARQALYCGQQLNVPTLIKEKRAKTLINFKAEHTSVDLDGVDYPIDAVHFDGNMNFIGIFGLTGDFEGWFSNDEARVPILAKMKVLIGNVTLELMKWTRPGWSPPRAKG
ncbi:MAG TPA: DUF3108 domain-containing protein [Bacteroidota bacterium]|nr:DUF3108 domain-containing protein [Bacteroidota bacterium]